ncbi:MAG TPA: hypothetical protein VGL48_07835 [Acidimicrobiales bacterium]
MSDERDLGRAGGQNTGFGKKSIFQVALNRLHRPAIQAVLDEVEASDLPHRGVRGLGVDRRLASLR